MNVTISKKFVFPSGAHGNRQRLILQLIAEGLDRLDPLLRELNKATGNPISKRQLQRDLDKLRNNKLILADTGHKLMLNEQTKVPPRLRAEEIQALALARSFSKQFKERGYGVFKNFEDAIEGVILEMESRTGRAVRDLSCIQFEEIPWMEGHEYLTDIIDYIQQKAVISFSYESPFKGERRYDEVSPGFLKTYDHRWYFIGKTKDCFHIPFDISRLKTKPQIVKGGRYQEVTPHDTLYKHVYGISLGWEQFSKPEDVILRFVKPQHIYCLKPKLHESAVAIKGSETKTTIDVRLHLTITYELVMKILGWNKFVKVMKPVPLKKKVKELLRETSNLY